MLQAAPPPPNWRTRLIAAGIVVGVAAYFIATAIGFGADGFDAAAAEARLPSLYGSTAVLDLPAGPYLISWVAIYPDTPVETGWNVNLRFANTATGEAFNKTYVWTDAFSCINDCRAETRNILERVDLQGGTYHVTARVLFANATQGTSPPIQAMMSFIPNERAVFYGSYIWFGLGCFLVLFGMVGLWGRRDRKRAHKWLEWKHKEMGTPMEEEPKRGRRRRKKE